MAEIDPAVAGQFLFDNFDIQGKAHNEDNTLQELGLTAQHKGWLVRHIRDDYGGGSDSLDQDVSIFHKLMRHAKDNSIFLDSDNNNMIKWLVQEVKSNDGDVAKVIREYQAEPGDVEAPEGYEPYDIPEEEAPEGYEPYDIPEEERSPDLHHRDEIDTGGADSSSKPDWSDAEEMAGIYDDIYDDDIDYEISDDEDYDYDTDYESDIEEDDVDIDEQPPTRPNRKPINPDSSSSSTRDDYNI